MHDQKSSSTPVIHQLKSTGAWNAAWDVFAELDPVWTEKFLDMGFTPVMRGYLDQKTWELIAIAVDASCTHMYGWACAATYAARSTPARPRKRCSPSCRG
jgi:hypothetical protein